MSSPMILVPQLRTKAQIRWEEWKARRHRGRPDRKLPGVWMGELTDQRFGCIHVCPMCRFRDIWELRRRGYRWDSDYPGAGYCDRCKKYNNKLYVFYAEEKFKYVRVTEEDHRRRVQTAVVPREEILALTMQSNRLKGGKKLCRQ